MEQTDSQKRLFLVYKNQNFAPSFAIFCSEDEARQLEYNSKETGLILCFDRIPYYESVEALNLAIQAAEASAVEKIKGTGLTLL